MDDMMGSMGAWMILWAILGLVVLGLTVAGTVWLVRSLITGDQGRPQVPPEDPVRRELRRRYAAGEIDREEFLQRKVDLD
ncbi:SHOCT domain-containing protein [Acrocarpospora sp. B8E8]|uniref:SHOCT domain-containing protein n=1 Tax=Acrocarpospora sp. B8E8 TaxID=3153572 RepID=UPI00325F70D8